MRNEILSLARRESAYVAEADTNPSYDWVAACDADGGMRRTSR